MSAQELAELGVLDEEDGVPDEPGTLLDELVVFMRRFLVLPPEGFDLLALWTLHTHAIEAFEDTPFLAVTSAEPESGKTRVLEVLELLVRRPWRVVLPSEAVLFRKVSAEQPTLLLDEVDAVFGPKAGQHEGLRALLNAGNRRGTRVPRCVGKSEIRLEEFEVFCPRALAGIGSLPDTIASRSVPLRLKRRAPGERVEALRWREIEPQAHDLRDRLSGWAEATVGRLREALRPDSPSALGDRLADSCEPLLTIADLAGGRWPERARRALVSLCTGERIEEDSLGVRLLRDCRAIFDALPSGEASSEESPTPDRISSEDLCSRLREIEEAPWAELYKGSGLTKRSLAVHLRPFGIGPASVRFRDGSTLKGYLRKDFEDAWSRYLSSKATSSGTTSQPEEEGDDGRAQAEETIGSRDGVTDQSPPGESRSETVCEFFWGEDAAQPCQRCGRPYEEHFF